MKKNVILRLCLLMTVALSLSSCVRDEILSSGKNGKPSTENLTAAKFSSKSFWKEDEKYISKVQQVFLKHANMEHVQARYGELYWDYAMTFGQFNETYLVVPVIKNNKVVTLMEAIRIKDKLHLYEKEDKELMDFFYHVIYSRIVSTGENISSNKNPLAKGVTYVCTTRTLEVGCFDGEPNCEPMFTTTTVCKWTTLPQKSFDPIGLDGGGGGGSGGDNNTYDYPDPPPQTPCENISLQKNDTDFKNRIDNLKGKTGLTKETGYIQRTDGNYTYLDNASATEEKNSLTLPYLYDTANKDIYGYMHTHVKDFWYTTTTGGQELKPGIKIFSPGDVSAFMDMLKNAQEAGRPFEDIYAVMVTSKNTYELRFTGDSSQIKTFTKDQITTHTTLFGKFIEDLEHSNTKDLELGMLQYFEKKMDLKGVNLYRMNSDGTTTDIKLNATKTDTVESNCP